MPRTPRNPGSGQAPFNGPARGAKDDKNGPGWGGPARGASTSRLDKMDPEKAAAIIDFVYNLGAGQLKGSNLRRRVNAQDWEEVPFELRKWVRGGGRVLRGLVLRREAEAGLVEQGAVQ